MKVKDVRDVEDTEGIKEHNDRRGVEAFEDEERRKES